MEDRQKSGVIENTTPLSEPGVLAEGNGAQPEEARIEKAIKLVELQRDLTQMVKGLETLQRQVLSQMGAIQYVQQKIAQLTAKKE